MSDSEDDELLQIALQEQSQRNVNYTRPSSKSSKPVINHVQPPSNHRSSTKPVASSKPQHRRNETEDDDEDSEIEMLSISSGDDDDDHEYEVGERKAKNRGRGVGRKDEENVWSGDEPDAWKRVDEADVNFSSF
ncbi:hypothetical protein Tco_1306331 [Tanacetum coccineum]